MLKEEKTTNRPTGASTKATVEKNNSIYWKKPLAEPDSG